MQFIDRKAKYPNRWTLVKENGTSEVVTLIRNDEPIVEGTPMNADTLNSLSNVAGADAARAQAEAAAAEAKNSADSIASAAESASQSAAAAKTSEANAKAAADKASAIVSTDKTLSLDGAAADAKAVGTALSNKLGRTESASSVNGFTFASQTSDPGTGSALESGKLLVVYV